MLADDLIDAFKEFDNLAVHRGSANLVAAINGLPRDDATYLAVTDDAFNRPMDEPQLFRLVSILYELCLHDGRSAPALAQVVRRAIQRKSDRDCGVNALAALVNVVRSASSCLKLKMTLDELEELGRDATAYCELEHNGKALLKVCDLARRR